MEKMLEMITGKVRKLIDYMKKDNIFQLFLKEKVKTKTHEEIINEYLNVSRFAIPVIGKISSGKSTFLNALLGTQTLETNSNITTQFFCIIRHNPEATVPKLFSVKIEKNSKEINFMKKECVAEGESQIKFTISKINKEMNVVKKKKDLQIREDNINEFDNFFFLLELKISIFEFNENLQQFHPFFEFIDIPGLNETENFYLENLIPLIKNHVKFCIFVFDSEKIESSDSFQVVRDVKKHFDLKFGNSLLVCNKMDLVKEENKDKLITTFRSLFLPKIELSPDKNKSFPIDSITFLNDMNKSSEFKHYINFLYNKYKKLQDHSKPFLRFYGSNFKETIKDQLKKQDWMNYKEKKTEEDIKYVTEIYDKIKIDALNNQLWDKVGFDLTKSWEEHINFLVDEYHRFNYVKNKIKWNKPELFTQLSSYFFNTFQLLFSQYQNDLKDKIVLLIENNKNKYENLLNQEVKKNEELTNFLSEFQKKVNELIELSSITPADDQRDIEFTAQFINILIENYLNEAKSNEYINNEISCVQNGQSDEKLNKIVDNVNSQEFIQKMLMAIKNAKLLTKIDNNNNENIFDKKEKLKEETLTMNLCTNQKDYFEKKKNQMSTILEKIKMVKDQDD